MSLIVKAFGNPVESEWHQQLGLLPEHSALSKIKEALELVGKNKAYTNIYIPHRAESADGIATWCVTLEMETKLNTNAFH